MPASSTDRARRRSFPSLSAICARAQASSITASHNPPHDNGYKVYFSDGAQVIEPHASGIIARVNAAGGVPAPDEERGEIVTLGREVDEPTWRGSRHSSSIRHWCGRNATCALSSRPIHGTGGVIIKPMLERLGFTFDVVRRTGSVRRAFPDGGIAQPGECRGAETRNRTGEKEKRRPASSRPIRIATGWAWRCGALSGEMKLLTGNQIGSLLAYYRAKTLFEQGVLNSGERSPRRHHQDLRHDRSAKSDRGKVRSALCRNADRLQIHRRQA